MYKKTGFSQFDEHWQSYNVLCNVCSTKYNYIGKFETLLDDVKQVFQKLNVPKNMEFPYNKKHYVDINKEIKHYYRNVPNEDIEKIYDIYKIDFEAFNYKINDVL